MQDALMICYIVANMFHSGYLSDAVEFVRQVFAHCLGFFGSTSVPERSVTEPPALFHEFEEWAQRLTRMESYVTSMA